VTDEIQAAPGAWIVQSRFGNGFYLCDPGVFETMYAPATEADA
jgi:hypothetical protein